MDEHSIRQHASTTWPVPGNVCAGQRPGKARKLVLAKPLSSQKGGWYSMAHQLLRWVLQYYCCRCNPLYAVTAQQRWMIRPIYIAKCIMTMWRFAGGGIAGGGAAPSPLHPPPNLFLNWLPLLSTLLHFFHRYRFFGFIFSFLIFIYIHRDLSLCASFLVRIAGGGAAPSPLHPPTRFYFLIDFPCYLLSFVFFICIPICFFDPPFP